MRVLLVIFGAIFLAIGVLGLIGGVVLLNLGRQGFTIKPGPLESDAYAIVLKDVDIGRGEDYSWAGLSIGPDEFVTLTLTGHSNDEAKDFFVGLAEESTVANYLDNVEYDELIGSGWTQVTPFQTKYFDFDYKRFSGANLPADPVKQGFWEIKEHGDGTRTLEWDVKSGRYWIVLMNEDYSQDIDATVELNIKIPSLFKLLGTAFLVGGALFVGIGSLSVYFGTRPPTPPVGGSTTPTPTPEQGGRGS